MLQALSEHLEAMKAKLPKKEPKVKESKKSERALVEARVCLLGALFKMDHHPMEVGSTLHHAAAITSTSICYACSARSCNL